MLAGSCLCGQVKYTLSITDIKMLVFCHCSRCRKETGSAFNSAIILPKSHFQLQQGGEHIAIYAHNGVNRHFCRDCGSPLYTSRDQDPENYRLRIGTLDSPIYPEKKCHIFTASKANWEEINDSHPQLEAGFSA